MMIEFTPVTLDSGPEDNEAVLLFRDGRLLAVLTCLGEIHEEMQGSWFVETTFNGVCEPSQLMFDSLSEAEVWANAT